MTKKEIIKDFMKNIILKERKGAADYGMSEHEFAYLILEAQDRGYISGAIDTSGLDGKSVNTSFCVVTLTGEELLGL